MGNVINSIQVFFADMFTKKEVCDDMLHAITNRYNIHIVQWSYDKHKLFIWVDKIDVNRYWEIESMSAKLIRQIKDIQHIMVIASNGNYVRCVKSNNNSNIFSYGNRYDTDR